MTTPDTLKERKRCKALMINKINAVIKWREKKKRKRFIFILEKLREDLVWLIEHPNHKQKQTET